MRNLDVMKTLLVFAFAVSSSMTSASTQEPAGRRAGQADVEGLMEAYVISKLQDALELTDEQFAQMVVAQKRISEHRWDYRRERATVLQQMREELQSTDGREERLASLLARLDELQRGFEDQEREHYRAIDAILDIRQRARYRVLEQEIQRRFQQIAREIRERRNPRPPRLPR